MNKKLTWNQVFAMAKTHALAAFGATLMGAVVLPIASMFFLKTLFSLIFVLIYAILIYNKGIDTARQDKLYNKEAKGFLLKGLFLPIGIYVIWLFLFILYKVSWDYNIISYNSGFINNLLFLIWNYPFFGFLNAVNGNLDAFGIILFFVVSMASSCGGYIAGIKGFDISEKVSKMVYEENDTKEGEK